MGKEIWVRYKNGKLESRDNPGSCSCWSKLTTARYFQLWKLLDTEGNKEAVIELKRLASRVGIISVDAPLLLDLFEKAVREGEV